MDGGKKVASKGCCPNEGLKRGAWTSHEDKLLSDYIRVHGLGRWRSLPANAGLNRCGKSCRLRWLNYLRPDIKRGNITTEEEELIIRLHKLLGNRWSLIAGRLPGRTDNEVKNYWNTYLRKQMSGNGSEQESSSLTTKKMPLQKPNTGKERGSEANAIRTKAVRSRRAPAADQIRPNSANSSPNTSRPATPMRPDSLLDFDGHVETPPLSAEVEGTWMPDMMQDSILFQLSADQTSYITSHTLHDVVGLLDSEMKESEGTCPFLDPDMWDSLVMPHKI